MTPAPDCLIEAGAILCGADASGGFTTISDAAIHVVGGNIAEIGPTAGLRARFPDLPRYGGQGLCHAGHGQWPPSLGHHAPHAWCAFAPLEFWLPRFRAQRRVPLRLDTDGFRMGCDAYGSTDMWMSPAADLGDFHLQRMDRLEPVAWSDPSAIDSLQ